MKRIVIGGQIDKQKVADITAKVAGDRATIEIKSDIEAAMAIALLGMGECATISMPGHIKSEEEIKAEVEAGKKAYGFTAQHAEEVVPIIFKYLL